MRDNVPREKGEIWESKPDEECDGGRDQLINSAWGGSGGSWKGTIRETGVMVNAITRFPKLRIGVEQV